AEVATGVLHNVGNVLNSVNVAAALVKQTLHKSEVVSLQKAGSLITQHKDNLAAYMTADSRGRQLPTFLVEVSKCLLQERDMLLSEFQALEQGLEHIKQIVSAQQAQASG